MSNPSPPASGLPTWQPQVNSELGFVHGLRTVPRAVALLRELPQVLRLLLIPLVLTALLDAAAFYVSYDYLSAQLLSLLPQEGLWTVLRGLLSLLVAGVIIFGLSWTFGLVYLLLCELVVDSVSELVEERLTGHHGSVADLRSRLRSLLQSLWQALVLMGVGAVALLLSVIPLIGPVLTVLVSITALGYSFFAIAAGRKARTLSDRWMLARGHLSAVMGLGVPVFLASLVPLGNLLLLPVFVIAGTLLFLDIEGSRAK